jgi:hypothetical protein
LLTVEISEKLEGMLPTDQEGLIDCKGTISLLLQSGEEQVIFFCWAFRPKETFRIDKRVNLIVGRGATATLPVTCIGPHPTEQHHTWQRELHGVYLPG